MICVHDFLRGEVSVKVGVMEFGLLLRVTLVCLSIYDATNDRHGPTPLFRVESPQSGRLFRQAIIAHCLSANQRSDELNCERVSFADPRVSGRQSNKQHSLLYAII